MCVDSLADKSEDHIYRANQDGKRSNDMMTNSKVKLKSEQINKNQK